ncbi:MAG: DUF362 domain-containing protein [Syntrophaceae bacterium]|nr:DUF362 domain-containing protein [Syntrophaceae bacterium]
MVNHSNFHGPLTRRNFLKLASAGACFSLLSPFITRIQATSATPLYWITDIPNSPLGGRGNGNSHAGLEYLFHWMGRSGLKLYRSSKETVLSGFNGLIDAADVVLIKVNAQWKYRGCTNSDLIRGLIQRILDHPDGFRGEVVLFENGSGRGSLSCDKQAFLYGEDGIHANANDESHTFLYLVDHVFRDPRVSAYLLDPVRTVSIPAGDHSTQGFRIFENVSYPCFNTAGGRRVELKEGIWNGTGYQQNLKIINVPVLKHHDEGGSEITASLKHMYGVLSMDDGLVDFRHYRGLGETCGKMMASVRAPVLHILDAIWVSHRSLLGYPADTTFRANQILASQDPVALDYWAAKHILYPIDRNPRHHPDFPGIDRWLTESRDLINSLGGLNSLDSSLRLHRVTKAENEMSVLKKKCLGSYNFNFKVS